MSKANSFATQATFTSKSLSSQYNSQSGYAIPSSLTPFFTNKLNKKDKFPTKETIGCFNCTFLNQLFSLCNVTKKPKLRRKNPQGTQISSDQENERIVFPDIHFEDPLGPRKLDIMEFIDESKEISSQSILPIKDSMLLRSPSNASLSNEFRPKQTFNYPLNSLFIYRNEENGELLLTKICFERESILKGRSFENLASLQKSVIPRDKMKKCISFIGNEGFEVETAKILANHFHEENKHLILDISSDCNVLLQFMKEFFQVVSLQSNLYVAQQLKNEVASHQEFSEKIDFILSDPLGFKGLQANADVIHLNFGHFHAKSLEKNNLLFEMALKYTGLSNFLLVTLPKLTSIEQILVFFGKILSKFQDRNLRIVYNLARKSQTNSVYAIIEKEDSRNFEEEAIFFSRYLTNESKPLTENNPKLVESLRRMLLEKGSRVFLDLIKTLEDNYTPKHLLLQKFLELAQSFDDATYFLFEESMSNIRTISDFNAFSYHNNSNHKAKNSNLAFLDNSKLIPEVTRSFSSYSKSERNESEENSRTVKGELEEVYSESRKLIMNLIYDKNISSY